MEETTKPLSETESEKEELTQKEIEQVAGGFNPQPEPPGRA